MKIPPVPLLAVIVSAVVRMFAPPVPIPLAALPVLKAMVPPAPLLSNVPAACVIETPLVLPPVLVATVIVPPAPVAMPRAPNRRCRQWPCSR